MPSAPATTEAPTWARASPVLARAGGKGSGGNDKDAVKACVAEMREAGWPVEEAFTERGAFSPTRAVSRKPTLVQLTETHAATTIEDDAGAWVYCSNESFALPLTHASLSRCMGVGRTYESGTAIRAYVFAPGKKARRAMLFDAPPAKHACV